MKMMALVYEGTMNAETLSLKIPGWKWAKNIFYYLLI
jgi:hypothetical protein